MELLGAGAVGVWTWGVQCPPEARALPLMYVSPCHLLCPSNRCPAGPSAPRDDAHTQPEAVPTALPPLQVKALRERFPLVDIMCDGGVNPETVKQCAAAGANAVVAGTAVFCSKDGPAAAIAQIRAPLLERFGA